MICGAVNLIDLDLSRVPADVDHLLRLRGHKVLTDGGDGRLCTRSEVPYWAGV